MYSVTRSGLSFMRGVDEECIATANSPTCYFTPFLTITIDKHISLPVRVSQPYSVGKPSLTNCGRFRSMASTGRKSGSSTTLSGSGSSG